MLGIMEDGGRGPSTLPLGVELSSQDVTSAASALGEGSSFRCGQTSEPRNTRINRAWVAFAWQFGEHIRPLAQTLFQRKWPR